MSVSRAGYITDGSGPYGMTVREEEAARLLASGLSHAEIAAAMFVEVTTVKFHLTQAMRKTGCVTSRQLMAKWHCEQDVPASERSGYERGFHDGLRIRRDEVIRDLRAEFDARQAARREAA